MTMGMFSATREKFLLNQIRLTVTGISAGADPQTVTVTPNYSRGIDFAVGTPDHDLVIGAADRCSLVGVTVPVQLMAPATAALDKAITRLTPTTLSFPSGAVTDPFVANGNEYLQPQLNNTRLKLRGDILRWLDDDIMVLFYAKTVAGAGTVFVDITQATLDSAEFLADLDNEHLVGGNGFAFNGGGGVIDTDAEVAANAQLLVNKTSSIPVGGVADADNSVFPAVDTGGGPDNITGILTFKWTGEARNSPLICHVDTGGGLPLSPNGGSVTIAWDSGVNRIFRL